MDCCQPMEFSRQEYWSGLPFPSPGELPDPGIGPRSPALQADALLSESSGKPVYTKLICTFFLSFFLIFYNIPHPFLEPKRSVQSVQSLSRV